MTIVAPLLKNEKGFLIKQKTKNKNANKHPNVDKWKNSA